MGELLRKLIGPGRSRFEQAVEREEPQPLEGTRMDLFNSIIPNFFAEQGLWGHTGYYGTPALADRVWVADRCMQLNAQQLASMPLRFNGAKEPMWVSNPDPNWYPNGIGDAVFAVVKQIYGWGFSCLYVTDRYNDGFPRTWTVLDSSMVNIRLEDGRRAYKLGETELDPRRVVQIDRNPGVALHGTSAIRAYAQVAWGLLAAGNQSLGVSQGGMPKFYLKSERKLTKEQAEGLQGQWATATDARGALPPVVPPEITPTEMSFNPSDLALLESQEWNARILATAYGVPSVILNMALQGGLTYQNPLALMQMWWLTELRTTAKRVSDALSAQMLPRGQWVWLDATDITTEQILAEDDPQSATAQATPAQQPGVAAAPLRAIGGQV